MRAGHFGKGIPVDIERYAELYRRKLLEDVLPFWVGHSLDRECGGYFTCLDRRGEVFDTDKFIWHQGRQVWTLATMFRAVRPEESWLQAARLGAEFLRDRARDEQGWFYFSTDRTGRPLTYPCIFSDCFAAMGLGAFASAGGEGWARELARQTYHGVQQWLIEKPDPWSRYIPGARPMESMVYDMINVNLSLELSEVLDEPGVRQAGTAGMERIIQRFVDRREGLVFEHVAPDGSHPDTFAGRLIAPGHALECLWFLIEAGGRWDRPEVAWLAAEAMGDMLEFGWDAREGGFFHFLDARGKPPEQLEWDQKLWWVHAEALVALLAAYRHGREERFAKWFEKVHDYAWGHFNDDEHGEWFGYLSRGGEVLLDLKGGKWKGCFHVPRCLWKCWRLLEELEGEGP